MMAGIMTKQQFQTEVLEGKGPILLDFYADWCGPCRMLSPVLEAVSKQRPDCSIVKLNVDAQAELAAAFQVSSIPMLVLLQDGERRGSLVGLQSEKEILNLLDISEDLCYSKTDT